MKKIFYTFLFLNLAINVTSQTVFHTEDIENFYQAFDKIYTTTDKQKQLEIVQKEYLNKGSLGLKYTNDNSLNNYKKAVVQDWLNMILNSKQSLERIRPYFENLSIQKKILEQKFVYFKELYPEFKDGDVYFVIGLGVFGGRPSDKNLIIGCELMAKDSPDWAVSIVLHEYVHTLQKMSFNALLAHSISEGSADFIAELVNNKSLRESYPNSYIDFGYQNEDVIWEEYKNFIASNQKGNYYDWLYGQKGITINETQMKDLGYFIGYKICQSYYNSASDKKKAIKEIIELDLSTDEKAKQFLLQSNYVPKKDLEFIKNLKFSKITPVKKNIIMGIQGYTIEKDNVIFTFKLPKSFDKNNLKQITIAGSFNGWNPKDLDYKMTLLNDNLYQYSLPKSKLDKKSYEFKFVINGDNWQSVPENASNVNNGNLTLELK